MALALMRAHLWSFFCQHSVRNRFQPGNSKQAKLPFEFVESYANRFEKNLMSKNHALKFMKLVQMQVALTRGGLIYDFAYNSKNISLAEFGLSKWLVFSEKG